MALVTCSFYMNMQGNDANCWSFVKGPLRGGNNFFCSHNGKSGLPLV